MGKYNIGDKVKTADEWNNGRGIVIPEGSIVEVLWQGTELCQCKFKEFEVMYEYEWLGEVVKTQTNADRIRSMSDEELAELLIRQHACDKCDYFGGGARCKAPSGFVCTNGYAEALMLQWLKSEAKE